MRPLRGRRLRVLGLGARGEEVRSLQEELARLGFDPGPVDGRYGLLTRQAVRECQRRYGLEADGIAGPELFRLLREPALRLGGDQAVLGVVDPAIPLPLERWSSRYPFLSAVVWPAPLPGGTQPASLAASWSRILEAAGAGRPGAPPWVWRILCQPDPTSLGGEPPGEGGAREPGRPAPSWSPGRRERGELVAAITRVVDRFHPLAVDLDLEPVLPGDGRRWLKVLAALREALGRRGVLLLATRDVARRPPLWPAWADDLPDGLLARHVHLLILARRPAPNTRPPGGVGAAVVEGLLERVPVAQAYKVAVEVPLVAARWTQGPDRPLEGPELLPYRAARAEAMKHGRRLRWDEGAGALTFRLHRGLQNEQYWLPSARSLERLLARAAARRVAGVVLSPLGEEDPRLARVVPGPLSLWRPGVPDGPDIPPAAGA